MSFDEGQTVEMCDPLLRVFLQALDSHPGNSVGVTLTISGVVITGTAVSAREYFQGVAEEMRRDSDGKDQPPHIQQVADALANAGGSGVVHDASVASFIHLKQARVLAGEKLLPGSGMWWRGRVSGVDGFTLGVLSL